MAAPAGPEKNAAETARDMYSAFVDGRLNDLLSYLHPKVTWEPVTRPGRSFYLGHAETLQLVNDVRDALGAFRIEWEQITELGDGRVVCAGHIVLITDAGEAPGPFVESTLTFRDGLIVDLASRPRSDSDPSSSDVLPADT
jgi:ketosteroid isomerase-like protein